MKPPPFSYHDPQTVDEAVALLGRLDNAKLLAGGQSLMPMLNLRFVQPDHVIDLNRVEGLSYIREAGGALEIGAMTRQRDLEFSDVVRARWPLLHEALLQVGHRQTRNRGTIGGSLCHLDPAAELVTLARGARCDRDGRRDRTARARSHSRNFPVAYMTPAIELNEMLIADLAFRTGRPVTATPSSSSPAATATSPSCRRRRCWKAMPPARSPAPRSRSAAWARRRCAPARSSRRIIGQTPLGRPVPRDACESCRKFEAIDDVHAPASYRQHLAAVLSRRALEKAYARLRGTEPRHGAH